jgi:fructokinase
LERMLAGYLQNYEVMEGMLNYVVHPALGDNAGLLGALALGQQALKHR